MNPEETDKIPRTEPAPPAIHIIAIGNELLNGETRDTNTYWLIKALTRRGGKVSRVVMISDDFDSVQREIEAAKAEGVDLVITTGGLGPTDDDCTFAAIANCMRRDLELNEEALNMVKERIRAMAKYRPGLPTELTEERKSMARIPKGAVPLRNPAGVAPGILFVEDGMTVIALPGVPGEMMAIFKVTLKDFWKDFFKGICYVRRNIVLKGIPEAELWPYVRRALEKDPGVYIKSRLKVAGKIAETDEVRPPEELPWMIVLHFSVISCTRKEGADRIDRLAGELIDELTASYQYPLHIDMKPGNV
jgi:nicotinamide-nucleotide amidase